MASSVYRSPFPTPRGTTTTTAPHDRHRYRLASTLLDLGPASGSSGPSTSRHRRPCPTITNGRPGSRLATQQHGHCAGRNAEHDGAACAQNLTPSSDWMIRMSLRGIAFNQPSAERGGDNGDCNHRPPPFCPSPVPGLLLRRAPYDDLPEPAQKCADSALGNGSVAAGSPSPSLREIRRQSINYAAR